MAVLLIIVGLDLITARTFLFYPKKNFVLEYYTPQPDFKSAYAFLKNNMKPDDKIISPYPFMDFIYLKKFDYALGISYTGRYEDSSVIHNNSEYYTKAPSVSVDDIKKINQESNAFFILDTMAFARIDKEISNYIKNSGELVFKNKNGKSFIFIYKIIKS